MTLALRFPGPLDPGSVPRSVYALPSPCCGTDDEEKLGSTR